MAGAVLQQLRTQVSERPFESFRRSQPGIGVIYQLGKPEIGNDGCPLVGNQDVGLKSSNSNISLLKSGKASIASLQASYLRDRYPAHGDMRDLGLYPRSGETVSATLEIQAKES